MSRKSKRKQKIKKLESDDFFKHLLDTDAPSEPATQNTPNPQAKNTDSFEDILDAHEFDPDEKFIGARPPTPGGTSAGGIEGSKCSRDLKSLKLKTMISTSLDLHGKTYSEAVDSLKFFIDQKRSECKILDLKIITGRGLHSGDGGPVLARDIHIYVKKNFAESITFLETSPADAMINGVAVRGHFQVKLALN